MSDILKEEKKKEIYFKVQKLIDNEENEEALELIIKYRLSEFIVSRNVAVEKYKLTEKQFNKIEIVVIGGEEYCLKVRAEFYKLNNERKTKILTNLP